MVRISPSPGVWGKRQKHCSALLCLPRAVGSERCLLLTRLPLAPPHMPPSALQLHQPPACCLGLSGRCAGGPSQAPELLTHAHSRPFMFHICPSGTFWFLTSSRGDFTSTRTHTLPPQAKTKELCSAASLEGPCAYKLSETCLQSLGFLLSSA